MVNFSFWIWIRIHRAIPCAIDYRLSVL